MNIEALTALVRGRITGTRKGSEDLACEHSIRVSEKLKRFGYGEEVVVAGLLHDILEDSETTMEELKELGITDRTAELVRLVTHDSTLVGSDRRLIGILGNILTKRDNDALAIKVSDVMDNLLSCATMTPDRRQNMRLMKAPLMRNISKGDVPDAMWDELNEMIRVAFQEEGVPKLEE